MSSSVEFDVSALKGTERMHDILRMCIDNVAWAPLSNMRSITIPEVSLELCKCDGRIERRKIKKKSGLGGLYVGRESLVGGSLPIV